VTTNAAPEGALDPADELDELALAYGIEPDFIDAHGNLQRTAAQTKRALLRAMGIAADTPAEVRAAREARVAAGWERALPPVIVSVPESLSVPIVLPAQTPAVTWRLTLELGDEQSGRVSFADLPLLEARRHAGRELERRTLRLPPGLPPGYHQLRIEGASGALQVIVTPGVCWLPPAVAAGERLSGVAVQVYLLRSAANWGIGDFTDLRAFVALVAARGADVVGVNPLHGVTLDDPENASPYSPASRLLLNVWNIDVSAIPEFAASPTAEQGLREPQFAAALAACRGASLVDYSAIAELKLSILRGLFAGFSECAATERQAAFARYRAAQTPAVERSFRFTALREFFAAAGEGGADWQGWPIEYQDPASAAVERFARDNADAVTFVAWLTWVADTQLAQVAQAARPMRVGLYRDLAVGADPGGAETWCAGGALVMGARLGAPPDIYNPPGQNWDLPPYDPNALRREAYASFVELVRANMRYAGGLRIDHVMALQHVYWIPQGAAPRDGAYVRYPIEDLIGILALESQRARCLVVGEDLGTVPAGFRERMQDANILSYRVLFFERNDAGTFNPPAAYPRAALAIAGSHDLPPLAAWWSGADIGLRERLGILADPTAADAQLRSRAADRKAFMTALRDAGLVDARRALGRDELFTAAHVFLARTPCALAIAQLDDVTGEDQPVNVPTTTHEYPNWRRRLSRTIEELETDARFATLFEIFGAADRLRPHSWGASGSAAGSDRA
jgi:4-alpha-glucanotransferase